MIDEAGADVPDAGALLAPARLPGGRRGGAHRPGRVDPEADHARAARRSRLTARALRFPPTPELAARIAARPCRVSRELASLRRARAVGADVGRRRRRARVPAAVRSAVERAVPNARARRGARRRVRRARATPGSTQRITPPTGKTRSRALTERVDAVLLHPVWGFALFLAVNLVLFQSLFAGPHPPSTGSRAVFTWLGRGAASVLGDGMLHRPPRRRRDRRRRQRGRVPAADPAAVLLPRPARGLRLHGARRLPDGPHHEGA